VTTTAGAVAPTAPGRDRYIDVLRAAALVRVVTFHALGWAWLPLIFPSMGVMFALAGALAAGSLDRAASIGAFYRRRLRRLLLPFWLFGAVMVGIMLVRGWQVSLDDGSNPLTWRTAWFWVLPLSDPPASSQGYEWTAPLWYIRTYLWFVLLSPAVLWLFRRWPLRSGAVPVATMLLVSSGLLILEGRTSEIVIELCTYAGCWLLGIAHHDGALRRLPLARTLAGGIALMAAGAWYASYHREQYGASSIDNIPLANMLYCFGAVLLLLRLYPRVTWLGRVRPLDAVVGLLNQRAMTVYLWGNVAIAMAPLVLDRAGLGEYDTASTLSTWVRYGTAWALLFGIVLVAGWIEDVAAGRDVRILPGGLRASAPAVPGPAGAARKVIMVDNVVREGSAPGLPPAPHSDPGVLLAEAIGQTGPSAGAGPVPGSPALDAAAKATR
ncbi:MAG: acyltransferase family protein, partial [Actinomycetes bacterium]